MEKITFDNLPAAISKLLDKVDNIENLLLEIKSLPQPDRDQFLTIQEASRFLHLSVPTLYGKVQNGSIPVCKREKRLYFSQKDLTEWIIQGRIKTIQELRKEADR